jgi:hypothetical protein
MSVNTLYSPLSQEARAMLARQGKSRFHMLEDIAYWMNHRQESQKWLETVSKVITVTLTILSLLTPLIMHYFQSGWVATGICWVSALLLGNVGAAVKRHIENQAHDSTFVYSMDGLLQTDSPHAFQPKGLWDLEKDARLKSDWIIESEVQKRYSGSGKEIDRCIDKYGLERDTFPKVRTACSFARNKDAELKWATVAREIKQVVALRAQNPEAAKQIWRRAFTRAYEDSLHPLDFQTALKMHGDGVWGKKKWEAPPKKETTLEPEKEVQKAQPENFSKRFVTFAKLVKQTLFPEYPKENFHKIRLSNEGSLTLRNGKIEQIPLEKAKQAFEESLASRARKIEQIHLNKSLQAIDKEMIITHRFRQLCSTTLLLTPFLLATIRMVFAHSLAPLWITGGGVALTLACKGGFYLLANRVKTLDVSKQELKSQYHLLDHPNNGVAPGFRPKLAELARVQKQYDLYGIQCDEYGYRRAYARASVRGDEALTQPIKRNAQEGSAIAKKFIEDHQIIMEGPNKRVAKANQEAIERDEKALERPPQSLETIREQQKNHPEAKDLHTLTRPQSIEQQKSRLKERLNLYQTTLKEFEALQPLADKSVSTSVLDGLVQALLDEKTPPKEGLLKDARSLRRLQQLQNDPKFQSPQHIKGMIEEIKQQTAALNTP